MSEHEMPDWPPQASAVGLPDGTFRHGSTGQLFEVKNGRWERVGAALRAPQAATPAVGGAEVRDLIERLRNPMWVHSPVAFYSPQLEQEENLAAMNEAADMLAAQPASPLRGREARLQLALISVLDYERESAKFSGFSNCTCMGHSMAAENAYEIGECPHQKARAVLASPGTAHPESSKS